MEGFPKTVTVRDTALTLRMMGADDGPLMLDFAQQLPYHDLLFLRRDITKQSSIDRWLNDIASEKMYTLLAGSETQLLGYATLYRNDFDWSRHVAEIRVADFSKRSKDGAWPTADPRSLQRCALFGYPKSVLRA